MATTKNKPVVMTPFQRLNHLLRKNADAGQLITVCRELMLAQFQDDVEHGPSVPHIADIKLALWTMATKLNAMHREIETLKRRGRREKQNKTAKSQPELLKKEPEQAQALSNHGS